MVSYKALNTSPENIISNTCYRIRDGDRCQAVAIPESIISNTCYRIRDGDWCQACTVTESPISNTCHGIFWIFISNRFGNHYVTWIFIVAICYCGGCFRNVIVNSIYLNNICGCRDWEEHAKDERCQAYCKSFIHNFFPTHISATRSGVGSGLSPHMSPEGDLPCGGGGGVC